MVFSIDNSQGPDKQACPQRDQGSLDGVEYRCRTKAMSDLVLHLTRPCKYII